MGRQGYRQLVMVPLVLVGVLLVSTGSQVLHASMAGVWIPNRGQWKGPFLYRLQQRGLTFFLERQSLVVVLCRYPEHGMYAQISGHKEERSEQDTKTISCHAVRVRFPFLENSVVWMKAYDSTGHYYNFFLGSDPARWVTRVHGYRKVVVYAPDQQLQIQYVALEPNLLKMDLITRVRRKKQRWFIEIEGADSVQLIDKRLTLFTSVGTITMEVPIVYWAEDLRPVRYRVWLEESMHRLGIETWHTGASGKGIQRGTLVVDPVLRACTFSGSTASNYGFTATYDNQGNIYLGSIAFDVGYPVTTGAFQVNFAGAEDVAISKFSPDGTTLLWASYLGGSSEDNPSSMIVNSQGQLVVLGATSSSDFPVTNGVADPTYNGMTDAFVTIITSDGSALVGSTFLGGSSEDGVNDNLSATYYHYGDEHRGEVLVDENDYVYIVSQTSSPDFPVTPGAAQSVLAGGQDAFVAKLAPDLSSVVWATFLGGSNEDAAMGLRLTADHKVYVTGGTASSDFPVTPNAYQSSLQGNVDAYVTLLSADGTAILASTYLGTPMHDQSYRIDRDKQGKVYLFGHTEGSWSVVGNVYQVNGAHMFIHVLDSALTTTVLATTIGTSNSIGPELSPTAFMVDRCQRVYICGWMASGAVSLPITDDAFQSATDGQDFYLAVLAPNLSSLVYGTYFGTSGGWEHVDGGTSRFDPRGIVYEAMCVDCWAGNTLAVTQGAYSPTCNSSWNAAVFKFEFELMASAVFTFVPGSPVPCDTPIQFLGPSGASSYLWDFGDGTTSTEANPIHTYQLPDTYRVCLTVQDTGGCTDRWCTRLIVQCDSIPQVDTLTEECAVADLPSAFTPNQDGVNDTLYVRGCGIEEMLLRIYNRWGELVFESRDPRIGWDGTYRGKPQEMDVYAYYLWVRFENGQVLTKKGGVVLIR